MESHMLAPVPPTETLDEQARKRIKSWLETTGQTQTWLAERIGRNQPWMTRYLRGEFDADLETLQKIAREFGHPLSALLDLPAADPAETRLVTAWRRLSREGRDLILRQVEYWSQPRPAGGRARK
jgi:transcriptional regulator with XRE-family HTH domain